MRISRSFLQFSRPRYQSSDVIGEELRAERLLEAMCLGIGFEGLDLLGDALVGPAARERKKAPAIDGQGKLKQGGTEWSVRHCPLYIHW
jgi:hypothetical protein